MSHQVTSILPQPKNMDASIWRYMSFAKLVDLLASNELHFCRVDLLGDEFEASMPKKSIELERQFYSTMDGAAPQITQTLSAFRRFSRGWHYVNCWHMNETESDAMWKIYGLGDEGVAIQSTYASLAQVLPRDSSCELGLVVYIDYEEGQISTGNLYYPFVCKRLSFRHEQEVRIIHSEVGKGIEAFQAFMKERGGKHGELILPEQYVLFGPCPEEGVRVKVAVSDLVQRVIVSPTSKPWFKGVVESVVHKYGYEFPVALSGLRGEPIY